MSRMLHGKANIFYKNMKAVGALRQKTQTPLNLFFPSSFYWLLMQVVAEREQLPVEQARAGSQEAWRLLFQRYQLPLYVYIFELVRSEQTTLDIVQETFSSAARYLGTLREDGKFGSWLFGIAHQKCVQQWRRNAHEATMLQELAHSGEETEESPEQVLLRQEQEAEFLQFLAQLPPQHRSVLLLHYIEDFSLEQ
ncbi:MAG TPA: RNA polymerase sigma factor, partial [Candidatus Saccharimonadales bacterium]|nr:RNA polymerase sigma factor [Candidatus Saccharimonadales bacterium]